MFSCSRNDIALLSAFVGGICTRICAAMIAALSKVMRKVILRKDEIDGIAPVTALRCLLTTKEMELFLHYLGLIRVSVCDECSLSVAKSES